MAEVVMFPGVRREILEATPPTQPTIEPAPELTSEMVLRAAIDNQIEDVVVVGLLPDGSIYVSAWSDDDDAVAGKLLRAANYMTSIDFEEEYSE